MIQTVTPSHYTLMVGSLEMDKYQDTGVLKGNVLEVQKLSGDMKVEQEGKVQHMQQVQQLGNLQKGGTHGRLAVLVPREDNALLQEAGRVRVAVEDDNELGRKLELEVRKPEEVVRSILELAGLHASVSCCRVSLVSAQQCKFGCKTTT